ncbi:MAG: phosphoesterase [Legionellales bacterium RIFCSPHIGHO2_12_FULL_37_14]|nr:MAG: phosphoesterase [Legionellales bacterium RIFCSPHIGHO2_12_FULL_37_14]
MAETFPPGTHWRDSARSARFFMIDARAAFPLFLFLMHLRTWTGIIVLVSAIFFGVIEHFGFTVPIFLRSVVSTISGKIKSSQPWWRGYEY